MARSRRTRPAQDPAALLERLPLTPEQGEALRASGLLDLALTHRSYAYEHEGTPHNERLEFLGDAVLGLAVTEELYRAHPTLPEGDLATRRAAIVNTRALALVGSRLHLGDFVHLALGEGASRAYVLALLEPLLASDEMLEAGYDFKTRLQEIAAAKGLVPVYAITGEGPEHARIYTAEVSVEGTVTATGQGASKKDAELAAAASAVRAVLAESGEPLLPRG